MKPREQTGDVERFVTEIQRSKKYRGYEICEDTIRDLLRVELGQHNRQRDAVKAARKKLHRVVAPYLGDPDYEVAKTELETAFQLEDQTAIREANARILATHASTRERLSILDEFYPRIFEATGTPGTILDIACGLNPLCFAWMGLPASTRYYAYDIHRQRVGLINHYFSLVGMEPLARVQDVLVHTPVEQGDVAFLFKELHRFEGRQRGCSLRLLDALRVRHLVVSFSTKNLSQTRNLVSHFRRMFHRIVAERPWHVAEITIQNELVFCVDKS